MNIHGWFPLGLIAWISLQSKGLSRVFSNQFSSVQLLHHVQLFSTHGMKHTGFPVYHHHQLPELLKLMSIELVMLSNHPILYCPLLLLPSTFPSVRVFPNESALCIRWPKYWSFSFNICPSNEHSGLISFGMDWLELLAVQGTLKSLLQHHSSKASILQHSAFFVVQLSHPYMTTGKTIRSDQIRSVAQSCPTLCDPMNHSTPGLPKTH